MQHALCHRVDPEAFEHSKANLGVLAQRGPLRRGKRCRLTQKVLREGELADVVEAGGELRELELLARKAEACGQSNGKPRDALGVAPGINVPGINRFREARCGAQARGAVASVREPLQLRELDDVRLV